MAPVIELGIAVRKGARARTKVTPLAAGDEATLQLMTDAGQHGINDTILKSPKTLRGASRNFGCLAARGDANKPETHLQTLLGLTVAVKLCLRQRNFCMRE
jgi:hypothetical protein